MPGVTIYSKPDCPFCNHAKALLEARQITYEELDVTNDPGLLIEMASHTGGRTFPQIVIGDRVVGGYDDLRALDQRGGLLALLQA